LAGSVRAVGPGRFPTSTPPEVVAGDVAVCGAVTGLGPSVGSVRAFRPGRFPAEGSLPGIWAFGPGTLSPMASRAVSSRLFRLGDPIQRLLALGLGGGQNRYFTVTALGVSFHGFTQSVHRFPDVWHSYLRKVTQLVSFDFGLR
jgi:hypothetical protein